MVTFTITRPTASVRPTNPDFKRGSGADDVFGLAPDLASRSLAEILNENVDLTAEFGLPNTDEAARFLFGFTQDDQIDLVPFIRDGLGFSDPELVLSVLEIERFQAQSELATALVDLEAGLRQFGFNFGFADTRNEAIRLIFVNQGFFGWDTASSQPEAADIGDLTRTAARLQNEISTGVLGIDVGFVDDPSGNDRIFGRGGNDIIVDLEGNNLVYTDEGDDQITLGDGNDRIVDKGGDNVIVDLGGDNSINVLSNASFANPDPGTDRITTGAGNDNINAFDGRNFVDAGAGNNLLRGGDGYDEFTVGTGNDFVDVRGAIVDEDVNENGILDLGEDSNLNGQLDVGDTETFALLDIGIGFAANNVIFDKGGSDNLRASGNDTGDDIILSDVLVVEDTDSFPGFRALTLTPSEALGDDLIEAGAGDNLILDAGGNDTVRTLTGDDIIFTSYFVAGDDEISAGAGDDRIVPGSGADVITGGAGGDVINLSDTATATTGDGDADTLVYTGTADLSLESADFVSFFEGNGLDKIDVRGLEITGVGPGGLDFQVGDFDGEGDGADVLVGWDFNTANGFEAGIDPIIAILEEFNASTLTLANFIFADAALV